MSTVLTFRIGDRLMGIPVSQTLEILPYQGLSLFRVPLAYPHLEGIADHRKDVLPIFNLHRRFHGHPETSPDSMIIVATLGTTCYGILVDSVGGIVSVPSLTPPKDPVDGITPALLLGSGYAGAERIAVINLETMLTHEEPFLPVT